MPTSCWLYHTGYASYVRYNLLRSSRWLNSAVIMSRSKSGASNSGSTPLKGARHQRSNSSQQVDFFKSKMNPPYEKYWSKDKVQEGLKKGTLFQGSLTVSALKYDLSFVTNPSGGPGFMLEGMPARNRAFTNDVVVVKVVDNNEGTSAGSHQSTPSSLASTSSSEPPTKGSSNLPAKGQDVDVDTTGAKVADMSLKSGAVGGESPPPQKETLVDRLYSRGKREEEEEQMRMAQAQERQRKAKVVYIVEKVHNRACAGVIKAFDVSKGLALLSPGDSRVPRVIVPLKGLPEDLPRDFKKYQSTKFVCHIKSWEIGDIFPTGEIMRSLGEAGLVETETEALLIDHEIDYEEFSAEVEDCLPKESPWTIPKEEQQKRRDFRGECVFTVDPETARDLDDALHIKKISDDVYEIGVHIADVSYFVKPGTALDRVASKRATTTYLVHKAVPMLPRLLCENLCSLNPNEDKLSFSVVWRLSKKGEFLSEWMGRSIIRSCCKLSYGHAQNMIDNTWSQESLPPVTGGFSAAQLVESVLALNKLSNDLRTQRRAKGTLRLDQPKLHYFLDDNSGMPCGCEVYPIRHSNRMIEEFMLLANMTVARRLMDTFPVGAMLRRHPPPRPSVLEDLVTNCAKIGLVLDASSATAIQKSLDTCKGPGGKSELTEWERMVFVIMCVKTMELARYFSSGVHKSATSHHYALNVPLYTHFTSPIRRYADVVVHRQLAQALDMGRDFVLSPEEVEQQAVHCNKKKKAAKIAGDMSIDMFFSILLRETGPQTHKAMVINLQSRSCDVVLKEYGLVRTVYFNNMGLKSYAMKSGENSVPEVTLVWDDGNKENPPTQVLRVFSQVDVILSAVPKDIFKNKVVINPPV